MNENYVLLLDIYGELLSDIQRRALEMKYNSDLSLGEAAEEMGGVSRQSVNDARKKGEKHLLELEKVLGNAKRHKKISENLEKAEAIVKELPKEQREKLGEILENIRKEL